MPKIEYWSIAIRTDKEIGGMAAVEYHGETMLSPHVRVSSSAGAGACLDSEKLARAYLEAVKHVLDRRYGKNAWEAEVVPCSSNDSGISKKIHQDSAIVRARIRTGNFAPNRKVDVTDQDQNSRSIPTNTS